MEQNVFLEDRKAPTLEECMNFSMEGRENLGQQLPVTVYRLLEYSMREELQEMYGKDMQIQIFRNAGRRAGKYFAGKFLDLTLPLAPFVAQLQSRLEELKIGVLRIEKLDEASGKIILTVSEDADCSGLPILGETVCNYDEGFIAGILSAYMGKEYTAIEIDCWATGDRVCRFSTQPQE